jgi:predicted helicase
LRDKYLEELHANEVAILPYYVANLNIEATYAAVTGLGHHSHAYSWQDRNCRNCPASNPRWMTGS